MTERAWFRIAYVALFCILLPVGLVVWARQLDTLIVRPALHSLAAGLAIAGGGGALVFWATYAMWTYGHGLPASPFPPERLVREGPYRHVAHPIYLGAVAVALGVSIAAGSGAGLWIVTPVLAAASAAWVMGYEADATRARYRDGVTSRGETPASLQWLDRFWRRVLESTERIANSWAEATLGPLRFHSHGVYAAIGAALGVWIQLTLSGSSMLGWALVLVVAAVGGAAIWAQIVEGSSTLLRPFGYFGAVLGVSVAVLVAAMTGEDAWVLFVSFGVGSTITYAAGRLRCLVQGCCHGAPVARARGIVYTHPRSRVVRLSSLGGVPLHPTPLYSLLWSLVMFGSLLGLWLARAPLPFIAGFYFILAGLGRFVEEHFRGEPQTLVVGGLRLYQWLAIASFIAGTILTAFPGEPAPRPAAVDLSLWPWMLLVAGFSYAAYGIDIPNGRRRFSRLV